MLDCAPPPLDTATAAPPPNDGFLPPAPWQPGDDGPARAAGNVLCPVCYCRPCVPGCRLGLAEPELRDLDTGFGMR